MNRGQLISGRYPANHEQMTFSSKHQGPGQQTHDMGNPGQAGYKLQLAVKSASLSQPVSYMRYNLILSQSSRNICEGIRRGDKIVLMVA